jgi:hypothetical protein
VRRAPSAWKLTQDIPDDTVIVPLTVSLGSWTLAMVMPALLQLSSGVVAGEASGNQFATTGRQYDQKGYLTPMHY